MIETSRLILRLHQLDDFEFSHALWNHPLVYQHISGKPSSTQQSWGRLYNYLGHWQLRGYGYLLVEEKSTGQAIGEVGLANFMRDMQPLIQDPFEAGWVIHPQKHGKGFAFEALEALLRWNDQRLGAQDYWCMINPHNQASLKLAQKCRFLFDQKATYLENEVHLLRRSASIK